MRKMNTKLKIGVMAFAISLLWPVQNISAHCEIPCGIFEDTLRIELIREHITTIEKSMDQIKALSKENPVNHNQLVRWVNNKEFHAHELQEIVSQYFLHQRIQITDTGNESAYKKYVKQLTLLHELLVYAMKAKQTTDMQYVEKMRLTTEAFVGVYFHKH
jgi:nickel superoxide dismutase